ncbi:MAG: flagellar filament capping protein FliD [Acidimicrobiales bacterium]
MVNGPVSFSGLVSGLNTQSIINAEMAVYEQPLNNLQTEQSTINTKIADYQAINTQLLALQQSADALADPSAFNEAYSAATSNPSVATASVTSGTQTGSLTLAVDQLAVGSTQISAGTVASPNDIVTSGGVLIGSGGGALGITSIGAGSGLVTGTHAIAVTQSSSGATVSGSTSLAASTTIGASNDELDVAVNGAAQTVTLAAGTYTPSQLAQAVAAASGGSLTASAAGSGQLSIATTEQGSAASLQITGGSALSALGLSAGPAVVGTDGVISVDGTSTTVSDIAGTGTTSVVLNSGSGGTVTVGISGGLSAGSMTAEDVSVGDGSLASVVSAINNAGVGVTANALQVGTNSYALALTSNGTGTAASTTIDAQAFAGSGLGTLLTTTAAQNAVVSVGGVGGYQVTSQTNALAGLLPGITINLVSASTTPVTVTVGADGSSVAGTVQSLVSAANQLLSTISTDTAYNSQTKTAGPLNGDPSLTGLAQQVLAAVGQAVGTSGAGSDGTAGESAGLAITSQGTITFNQAAFEAAYAKNPTAVQSMFTEGGTFAASLPGYAGQVSVAGANDNTTPGSYTVSVTQSAQQAVDVGTSTWTSSTSGLAQAEAYTVTGGVATATYAASAGETIADVVNGMNAALAAAGIDASAALVGSPGSYQFQLASAAYGSAATFDVSSSGPDQLGLTAGGSTYTGTDVAGTINGLPAAGSGQFLSSFNSGDNSNGLVLQVTTPGITSATAVGSVTYAPGFGQGLAHIAATASLAPNGIIPVTIAGLQGTLAEVGSEISMQQQLVATQQAALTAEFTNMETTLSHLQSESSFLNQAFGIGSSSSGSSASASSSTSSGSSSSASGS